MRILSEIYIRRELLFNLVSRNLKSRYKNSFLGFLWSVLVPLFMAVVYMVFLRILRAGIPMEEILIGVFAWQFTAQCIGNGLSCISENSTLVKKVYFPKIILPLSVTMSNLVNFILSLLVQFAMVAILVTRHGSHISAWAIALPLLIGYHAVFCFAIALFLSALNVFFRDLEHLVGVLTTAWFFMSPAMYSMELVQQLATHFESPVLAEMIPNIYMLNPMAAIITAYRAMILPTVDFPLNFFTCITWIIPLVFLCAAYLLFRKLENYFADVY